MGRIIHVILTGGVGSRLWPLSRRSKPKQYLELFAGRSMFELTLERNRNITSEVLVVGNCGNSALSREVLKKLEIPAYEEIVEATPRNTAAALAFAAFSLKQEDVLLVTPADHIIEEGPAYERAVQQAIGFAEEGHLVTFGIKPTKPETGYGYIRHRKEKVLSFHEKPDRARAEEFVSSGDFLWNSGMFCFKAGSFLEELQAWNREIFETSKEAWDEAKEGQLNFEASMEIPAMSIDHAVMEKSSRLKVVKARFGWSDMGSFEAVYEYLKEKGHRIDLNNNMYIGDFKPTYFVGVNNCILISTKDANLIVDKKSSQGVKAVYQYLAQKHPELV